MLFVDMRGLGRYMLANQMIRPTAKFVLIQFVPKGQIATIYLPDGARPSTGGDFVVLATGPDVPAEPPIPPGTKVLLRSDAQNAIMGVDEKKKIGIIFYETIMAVVQEDEKLLTNAEIDAIAAN